MHTAAPTPSAAAVTVARVSAAAARRNTSAHIKCVSPFSFWGTTYHTYILHILRIYMLAAVSAYASSNSEEVPILVGAVKM